MFKERKICGYCIIIVKIIRYFFRKRPVDEPRAVEEDGGGAEAAAAAARELRHRGREIVA